ncbi:hypothetical protein [Streptomyces sp. NPDC005408]|uniref:hypothetical protein n=1 Tax=Streptomyces sp. NPDC005408 TaxID=3155341 RepID=UPI0033A2DC14
MRDLIVTENVTLDGVVEATENWFSPNQKGPRDLERRETGQAAQAAEENELIGQPPTRPPTPRTPRVPRPSGMTLQNRHCLRSLGPVRSIRPDQ